MSGFVTTAVLLTKFGEIESTIYDVSDLVKKTDYDDKILNIVEKQFTTSDYNNGIRDAKIK